MLEWAAEEAKDKEMKKIQNIIEKQTQQLKKVLEEADASKRKGELIYEHYQELQEILASVKDMKGRPWSEIQKKLMKNKIFKSLNEKEGTLTVEL